MGKRFLFCAFISLLVLPTFSQHEYKKWYFGTFAGLDFITSPPTILTNGGLWTSEGCATISDASGNLLFYTNGISVYNKNHTWMANGMGLAGDESATQTGLIVRQPNSQTIYYVFSLDAQAGIKGLQYSIVDMSLASGLGSVTVLNAPLHTPSTEKLAATSHCNGIDVWILSHDYGSNVFRAYLLGPSGLNSAQVTSSLGPVCDTLSHTMGQMKFSPDGRKIGAASYDSGFELYDFDPATGQVTNYLNLGPNYYMQYGCEFSPDGSKFYGARHPPSAAMNGAQFIQWNLCAGSPTAIVASQYSITIPSTVTAAYGQGGMQLAPDGKIYIATSYEQALSVINNPNQAGAACSYSHLAQSIAPKHVGYSLPSVVVYHSAKPNLSPFTFTSSCQTVSFTPPAGITLTASGCGSVQQPVASLLWLFGDTGASSTASSTATHPQYSYSSPGTYTAKLIVNYPCNSDTLSLPVTITHSVPLITISGKTVICQGESTVLTAAGALSYNWNGQSAQNSITVSPSTTTSYSVTGSSGSTICPVSSAVITVSVLTCTGLDGFQQSLIHVYPNPVKSLLKIESEKAGGLEIRDLSGKIILTRALKAGRDEIDVHQLPVGMYVVRLLTADEIRFLKICKERAD